MLGSKVSGECGLINFLSLEKKKRGPSTPDARPHQAMVMVSLLSDLLICCFFTAFDAITFVAPEMITVAVEEEQLR